MMDFNNLYEQCAGDIAAFAPEHTIEVINGQQKKTLTESDLDSYNFDKLLDHFNKTFNTEVTSEEVEDQAVKVFNSTDQLDYEYLQNKAFKFILMNKSMFHALDIDDSIEKFNAEDHLQNMKYIKALSMLLARYMMDDNKLQENMIPTCAECGGVIDEDSDEQVGPNEWICNDCIQEYAVDDKDEFFEDSVYDDWEDSDADRIGGYMDENIKDRLILAKQLNEHIQEAQKNGRLREELEDKKSPANLVRYELQKFVTENPKGTPEDVGSYNYEAWRAGINDKHRKSRAEQENADRDSNYASPKTTKQFDMLDNQIDDFLLDWVKKTKK